MVCCSIQRLMRLVRDGRLEEALQLSLELLEGTAKAVVGEEERERESDGRETC